MEYISSDTNIWLDFYSISKISMPFRLPYTYIMYREALRREIVSPPDLLECLEALGLQGVELTTEEFYYASNIAQKYIKLSGYDRTALAIAKLRNIVLLTGDNALRKAAVSEGVQVLGTIGILDQLYSENLINGTEYRKSLEEFLRHDERRLPKEEINKRLEKNYGKGGCGMCK